MTETDVVIIGAGHNGLVTAFYLGNGGFKPLVLERRVVTGGAAIPSSNVTVLLTFTTPGSQSAQIREPA